MTRLLVAPFARLAVSFGIIAAAACGAGPNGVIGPTAATTPSGDSLSPSPSPSPGPAPGGASCTTPTVTGMPSTVGEAGGRYLLSISAPSGCAWTAKGDVTWADVAPGSGRGDGTVQLTVNRNEVVDSRTLTVTVNGQSVRAVQEAARCVYTLDRARWDARWDDTSALVMLATSNAGCSWTARSSEPWVRPRTTGGLGNATIVLEIDRHLGLDPRRAVVTIGDQRFDVVQGRRP